MSSVVISGDVSGSVTLQAPSAAGTTTLTLPATSGTVLTTASGQWITTGSDIYYNTGNVGIGTTSPGTPLDVYGQTRVRNVIENSAIGSVTNFTIQRVTNDTRFCIGYTTVNDAWNLTASYGSTGAYKPIAFLTSDTERMRIDSSGNVLVGTTSQITTGGWTPLLSVLSSSNTAYFKTTGTGNSVVAFQVGANGQNGCVFINASGTTAGSITVNASTTAYNTSSDYRLKENIAPMIGALDKITQLKPVTYNWKSDGSDGQGFIAHELQEIVPDAVTGEKDAVDDDGNPKYQGVDTSFLVATLTAAIQEQQTIINDLKARITALENK